MINVAPASARPAGTGQRLWAPLAWLDGHWQRQVLLESGQDGCWARITPGVPQPADAQALGGPVLPAVVNAHSHAFQRGFAGLTERREQPQDDFWSWREQMYSLALRVTPTQLRAIAALLYAELLEGGYSHVCEFHYLHHGPDGQPYSDRFAMSRALVDAAVDTGIGLTLLPVLYERAGFRQPVLGERQRRFRTTVSEFLAIRDEVRRWRVPNVSAGMAIHSLRAASHESMTELVRACQGDAGPIHIHIAEQQAEVDDCLATTGHRPLAWLARHLPIDQRWHLVHATHADAPDIDAIAATGATVVVCPSTEADLGDGRFQLEAFTGSSVPFSIGSDSHVCRNWPQELRLLEYGQRLALQRRNVAALPERGSNSTAETLFAQVGRGGAAAAGFSSTEWGLRAGARADCLVLNAQASGLLAVEPHHLLDAAVFGCDAPPIDEVWVAGQRQVCGGRHRNRSTLQQQFVQAMHALTDAGH
ncbi:MAG: formimidoylglutamate deiminase [Betaproteobacteria bacterium]|nr:formimidoylglutamate deiminase [Betaproteobacteria bacterium]